MKSAPRYMFKIHALDTINNAEDGYHVSNSRFYADEDTAIEKAADYARESNAAMVVFKVHAIIEPKKKPVDVTFTDSGETVKWK